MRTTIQLSSLVRVELTPAGVKAWRRYCKAEGRDPRGSRIGGPELGYLRVRQLTICLGELMAIFGPVSRDRPFEGGAVTLVPDQLLPAELR